MNTRSVLYQEITREQLEECCRRYLGESLADGRLLSGGLFNTTYLVQTSSRKAILRLGPVNRSLLQPYERRLMEAEAMVLDALHSRNVPTSRLIALDLNGTFLERDVMVVEAMDAVSLSTVEVDKDTEARLCSEVGLLTAIIHSITAADLPMAFPKPFGRLGNILSGNGGETWREAISQEVEQWCALAKEHSLANEDFILRVRDCFMGYARLFDAVTEPRLVHADLWYGNILVNRDRKLAGIIDADRVVWGDPEWEFATGWMTGPDFCRGYGREPDPSEESCLRRRLYKLLMDLEDVYVLKCQYNIPEDGDALFARAEETLQELEMKL